MTINAKLAEHMGKFGVTFEEDGATVIASHDGKEVARGTNAKSVAKAALKALGLNNKGKPVKATKAAAPKKAKTKARKGKSDDEEDEDESTNIVPPKYRAKYAENGGHNGDDIAAFLAGYKNDEGVLDGKGFIALAKENGVEVGDFAQLAKNPAPGSLPRGFIGRARMTLGNSLRAIARKQGHLVVDGKKKKFDLSA